MTIYGYARVSTTTQGRDGNSLEIQTAELKAAGAEQIYQDVYTGSKTDRPNLQVLVDKLRAGDQLVVTKLDRFARTLIAGEQLISDLLAKGITVNILNMGVLDNTPIGGLVRKFLLAIAEFERAQIIERTQSGKAVAKKNPNFRDGRPPTYSKAQKQHALDLLKNGKTYREVTDLTGISKSTLIRYRRRVDDD